ncbi:PAS domain S-box protein [Aerosakkonema funiforme]|uniref:sensor domain-containing diguanylate cyclase n=1 Tax=Aerosakkonema funiforme TaxID=1246630 RepID=UPI0035B9A1D3
MGKQSAEMQQNQAYWLNSLLNAVFELCIVKDGEGRWLIANESALKLFGLEGLDYRGKTDVELADRSQLYREIFFNHIQPYGGDTWEESIRYSWKDIAISDGTTKTFEVKKVPICNPDGSPGAIGVVWRDITERVGVAKKTLSMEKYCCHLEKSVGNDAGEFLKIDRQLDIDPSELQRLEKELYKSEQRYSAIVEDSTEQIVRFTPDGTITFVNEAYCRYFGKQHQEIIGTQFIQFLLKEDREEFQKQIASLNRANPVTTIAHRSANSNGEICWLQWKYRAIFDERDCLVEFQFVGRDITLNEGEEKYKILFDTFPLGISITDKTGNIIEANAASEKILGLSKAEHKQRKFNSEAWQIIRPDGMPMPPAEFASVRALTENKKIENVEMGILKEGGEISWISVTAAPIPLKNYGVAIGYIDITDRKQMEKELLKSEERFRNLVNSAPLLLWTSSTDGNCDFLNQSWLDFTGRTMESEIGNGWMEGVHPEDFQLCWNTYFSALALRQNFEIEYRLRRADGEYRWILDKGVPRFDSDGTFIGYIGSCVDITATKQAQEDLIKSEQKLSLHIQQTPLAVIEWNVNFEIVEWNPAAEAIFGYSKSETIGSSGHIILPASAKDRVNCEIEQLLVSRGSNRTTKENLTKDGRTIVCEWYSTPLIAPDGNVIGIACLVQDITERVRSEEVLRETEAFLNLIVENIPNTIFVKDAENLKFVRLNKAGEELLGYSREELIGKSDYDFFPPEEVDFFRAKDLQLLAQKQLVDIPEERIHTKNKGIRILHTKKLAILDESGKPLYLLGISEDITDRKQAQAALRESEQRLSAIATNIPGCVFRSVLQADGRMNLVFINAGVYELTGLTVEQVLEHPELLQELVHPDDRTKFQESIAASIVSFQPLFQQYRIVTRSGQVKWIQDSVRFSRDSNGDVLVDGITLDITERMQAQEALRESEERFRQMTENSKEVFWICTADARQILYISPAYEKIWGRTCQSLYEEPLSWIDGIHPDDRELVVRRLNERMNAWDESRHSYEFRIVRPDGSICWINARCFAIRDRSGQIYRLAGISEDITERKLVEEAIRQQADRERVVATITQRIRGTLNLEEILNTAVLEVQQLLSCDRVVIYRIWPEGTGSVVTEAVVSHCEAILGRTFPEEVFPQSYHQLYRRGRVRAIADIENSYVAPCLADFVKEFGVKAKLVVPLTHGEELWGLLIAHQCTCVREWQQFEINLLQQLATQLAIAIQQASLFEKLAAANKELNRLACLDGLTQVANRRGFDEYLHREWRRLTREQLPLALILCDIDFFKQYNDTYGHQAGDDCLKQVANAIKQAVRRPADLVARYGGEEFAVILPNTKAEGALVVAEEIRDRVRSQQIPHANSGISPYVTISLGIAVTVPTLQTSPERLIHVADLGLYEAKYQGRDRAILKTWL